MSTLDLAIDAILTTFCAACAVLFVGVCLAWGWTVVSLISFLIGG